MFVWQCFGMIFRRCKFCALSVIPVAVLFFCDVEYSDSKFKYLNISVLCVSNCVYFVILLIFGGENLGGCLFIYQ